MGDFTKKLDTIHAYPTHEKILKKNKFYTQPHTIWQSHLFIDSMCIRLAALQRCRIVRLAVHENTTSNPSL